MYTVDLTTCTSNMDSPTQFVTIFFNFLPVAVITLGVIIYLIFLEFNLFFIMDSCIILGAAILILAVLKIVKLFLKSTECKVKRCKWSMMVGLGGITMCTIAPRVLIFFIDIGTRMDRHVMYLFLLPTITCLLLYFVFVVEFKAEFRPKPRKRIILGKLVIAIMNFFLLIIANVMVKKTNKEDKYIPLILWQIWFSATGFASSLDFVGVILGGRNFKDLDERSSRNTRGLELRTKVRRNRPDPQKY